LRKTLGKLPWYWVFLCLAAGIAIGWWHPGERSSLTAALEGRLLDLRHVLRGPIRAPDEFVIVAIDDKTLGPRSSLPRGALAAGVDWLTEAGAKVVAIDILLLDRETAPEGMNVSPGDAMLAAAVTRHGRTILATSEAAHVPVDPDLVLRNMFGRVNFTGRAAERPKDPVGFYLPIKEFAEVASLAHVNLLPDADRAIRRMALAMPIDRSSYIPAMPLEVVRLLRDVHRGDMHLNVGESVTLGNQALATDAYDSIGINYYGSEGAIPTYSFVDVVEGKVPPERFSGRAVFVGFTALAMGDIFLSPFAAEVPGVEVLATVAGNIAHYQYL